MNFNDEHAMRATHVFSNIEKNIKLILVAKNMHVAFVIGLKKTFLLRKCVDSRRMCPTNFSYFDSLAAKTSCLLGVITVLGKFRYCQVFVML